MHAAAMGLHPLGHWLGLILLAAFLRATRPAHVVSSFPDNTAQGEFKLLTQHTRTGNLYIGGINRLYKLSSDLVVQQMKVLGPKLDSPFCSADNSTCVCPENPNNCIRKEMDFYPKILIVDAGSKKLIVCGNLFQGTCSRIFLNDMDRVETSAVPVVANSKDRLTVGFLAPGPGSTLEFYVGATRTNEPGPDIFKNRIYSVSTRKLQSFELVHKGLTAQSAIAVEAKYRSQFLVHFVNGFSHQGFSYFLIVRKATAEDVMGSYQTYLARVCQSDSKYESYSEIPLSCKVGSTDYEIVKDVYISKLTKSLAYNVGLNERQDIMFGVFAKGQGSLYLSRPPSALCAYSMDNIREQFRQASENCFRGKRKTGPAYVTRSERCISTNFPIPPNFCGHDVNHPIEGFDPVKQEIGVSFPQGLTAVAVTLETDQTVAHIGTDKGHLLQVKIEGISTGTTYNESVVEEGAAIKPHMILDAKKEHLYAMTQNKVYKLQLSNCQNYKTCKECVQAGADPGCGWCTLKDRCCRKTECPGYNLAKRWLPSSTKLCPAILEVSPRIVLMEKVPTKVLVKLSLIPGLRKETYRCRYDHTKPSQPSIIRSATVTKNGLKCPTPEKWEVNNIPEGAGHLNMTLKIQVEDHTWLQTNITFYDCRQVKTCLGCTSGLLPCSWCLQKHKCVPSPGKQCGMGGTIQPTGTSTAGNPMVGQKFCPRITVGSSEILIPGDRERQIIVTVVNKALVSKDVSCQFKHNGKVITRTADVMPGDYFSSAASRQVRVRCEAVKFSPPKEIPYVIVPFSVVWRDGSGVLDNPENIQVQVYKCSAMVQSCGACLNLDPKYKCGWCHYHCSLKEDCPSSWLNVTDTCPDPQILRFSPSSGPVNGGTNITIHGINLGRNVDDVVGRVTVAGIPCHVAIKDYISASRITCMTGPASVSKKGFIRVFVSRKYRSKSRTKFQYVDPVLLDFYPKKGPVSGGTVVTVTGENLDAGSRVSVSIYAKSCEIVRRNSTMLQFVTAAQTKPMKTKISVNYDEEESLLSESYSYVPDPTIQSMLPEATIKSGGTQVTIKGRNLDAVQSPQFLINIGDEEFVTDCKQVTTDRMFCYTPDLSSVRLVTSIRSPARLSFGFVMDNVTALRNMTHDEHGKRGLAPLAIYPDPIFYPFPGDGILEYVEDKSIAVEGKFIQVFMILSAPSIIVGSKTVDVTSVSTDGKSIQFKPPKDPGKINRHGRVKVVVVYGNFEQSVGYIQYENIAASKLPLVLGLCFGMVLPIIVVVLLLVACLRRHNNMQKKKSVEDLDEIEMQPRPKKKQKRRYAGKTPLPEELPLQAEDAKEDELTEQEDETELGGPECLQNLLSRIKDLQLRDNVEKVVISNEKLKIGEIVGKGHFGCVYKGTYDDGEEEEPRKVAVKTLQVGHFDHESVEAFLKEGILMMNFDHPHVLTLLGVCINKKEHPMVVLPYMANGDLRSYVKDKKRSFTARQLLHLAQQVAEGMAYLASLHFVHRDLACRNCMIGENSGVKVADFGLSRDVYEKDYYSSSDHKAKLPIKWMALESLETYVFTFKTDVWSFGVLLWELMTRGVTPYPDVDIWDVRNYLASGRRMRQPNYCPENVYKIMRDCWHQDPAARPTFADLVNSLELIISPPKRRSNQEDPEPLYVNIKKADSVEYLEPLACPRDADVAEAEGEGEAEAEADGEGEGEGKGEVKDEAEGKEKGEGEVEAAGESTA